MTNLVPPFGPTPARIMIVGEAPGEEEVRQRRPFIGESGRQLDKMLGEAGIAITACFLTNVARERPPSYRDKKGKLKHNDISQWISDLKRSPWPDGARLNGKWVRPPIVEGLKLLELELQSVKPGLIIACGNLAMWALTEKWGIMKWRGSMLVTKTGIQVIPVYHPAAVLRQWELRAITVFDLRRAAKFQNGERYPVPNWNFILRPAFSQAQATIQMLLDRLDQGPVRIAIDIETRLGHTACTGFAWSKTHAICFPWMHSGHGHYWNEAEESDIQFLLYKLQTHPNIIAVGQNFLYDAQYFWRHNHYVPRINQDTMISQHSLFSDLPKSLAFIASMYSEYYVFWKDEGKSWAANQNEAELWHYNCLDCVYTWEVSFALEETAKRMRLEAVFKEQQELFWPVLKAMQRGVRVDSQRRNTLLGEVHDAIAHREQLLIDILGHPLNPNSNPQMKKLFYDDLQMPEIKHKDTGAATLNDDALQRLSARQPILKPLVNVIRDIRTLGVFMSMLSSPLDIDQRMRCSYNIGGSASGKSAPVTYRLSSNENAFGSGMNLQNVPSDKSKTQGKAKDRGATMGELLQLPNIRSIFIPDPGMTMFDMDLDRADLQVVCWEANDELLKAALRMGVDIHLMNVFTLDGKDPPPLEELVETHPKYLDHRGPRKLKREFSKVFCHATNYVGGARTVAIHTGRTIAEIDRSQKIWFGAHPGIERWHKRIESQVQRFRFVENSFGYRWYIFDRIDGILPEAVAWIPQSTVSNVINKAWKKLYQEEPRAEVLMQVHDSLVGQFPTRLKTELLPKIKAISSITIPYEDLLIIPVGIKTSEVSWGDCK